MPKDTIHGRGGCLSHLTRGMLLETIAFEGRDNGALEIWLTKKRFGTTVK